MSDQELVKKLLKGDKRALRTYCNRYSTRLYNFILRKVSNRKDAEEILQDTLLDGLEALRNFTGRSSLYTYLCAIAKYKTVDYYRKKRLKKIVFSRIPAAADLFSILTTPEDKLDEKITTETVHDILSRLRPRYREALKLKYLQGFSIKQVAQKMRISFKSAESILLRARGEFALIYEKGPDIRKLKKPT